MDPERWQRLKAIFHAAVELPPAAREAFLAEACGEDAALRQRLRVLLAAHEEPSDRLEGGVFQETLPALHEELQAAVEGLHIGPYRVIAELGRGGMGAVYRAVRDDGTFEQEVAVKLVKRGMDTDEIVRRFVHERQILASLVHPNIARLLDGGTTADGRPYFVLEHVDGQPITVYAEEAGLGVEARLRLFLQVAAAVQFAHQSLVVHRDLKPANILVGADGTPKLLDFGIAKLLAPAGATEWTALENQPLTPDYASPEQLAGRPVTTATDVYGLGLLLYEVLVGQNPAALARELGPPWRERPASQAARALAKAQENAELRRRARRLEGDLDTILSKALAADPMERYGTAGEMADDVLRHLSRRPVKARRPTWAYRAGRAVLRHRLASAFALSFLALSALVAWQGIEQRRLHHKAEMRLTFLIELLRAADPAASRGAEIKVSEVLAVGAKLLLHEKRDRPTWLFRELGDLTAEPETRSRLLQTIGDVQMSLGLPDAERPLRAALTLAQQERWHGWRLDAARSWTSLGHFYLGRSEYGRSRHAFEQALEERRHLLGPRAVGVAEVLNGLGLVALETDDQKLAGELFGEARAIYEERGEEGRLGVARTLNNLGLLAAAQGNRAEAARYVMQARDSYRELLGEDHPDSVRVLSNLAFSDFQDGDYAAAEAKFHEILRLRQQLFGQDHQDLALTLSSLAVLEARLGRLSVAESTVRKALAMRRRLGLTDDADYADALNTFATIVRMRGDREAARAAYQQNLGFYRRLFGEEAPDVALTLNGLAWLDLETGELAAAEAKARQALAIRDKTYGPEHPRIAESLFLLAKVLQAAGRPTEAAPLLRRSLKLRRKKLPPQHPLTAESLIGLGSFLVEHGLTAEAEPLLREGLAILRRVLPAGHVEIGFAASRLSVCYRAMGRLDEARALLEESRRSLAATVGERHPHTLEVRELQQQLDISSASPR